LPPSAWGRNQFTLAVSLHAPDQALREELIPTAHAYPIAKLLDDCRHYVTATGRRISFEYILLGGLNDHPRQAAALAQLLRGFQSHVNLIAYNPIDEEDFQRPSPQRVAAFKSALELRHVAVSVRASRGTWTKMPLAASSGGGWRWVNGWLVCRFNQ